MKPEGTEQPCDTTRTAYKNPSSTPMDVTVEIVDRCKTDGILIVYDKSNHKVRAASIPHGSTVTVVLQVPDSGRIDLDCNGVSGTGNGCTCSILATLAASAT